MKGYLTININDRNAKALVHQFNIPLQSVSRSVEGYDVIVIGI